MILLVRAADVLVQALEAASKPLVTVFVTVAAAASDRPPAHGFDACQMQHASHGMKCKSSAVCKTAAMLWVCRVHDTLTQSDCDSPVTNLPRNRGAEAIAVKTPSRPSGATDML